MIISDQADAIGLSNSRSSVSPERLRSALKNATAALLAEAELDRPWKSELSSSALSTATAMVALAITDRTSYLDKIAAGAKWLRKYQNADGGFGDTVRSKSNISTTALCWAALSFDDGGEGEGETTERAEQWLCNQVQCDRVQLARAVAGAIEDRYGKDRTFSVPILMTLALAGKLGSDGWNRIIPLPFELAALPHQCFGALQLPVVSYALPALIAIGQAIHHHSPSRFGLLRWLRTSLQSRTLRILESIQPVNGGFLEATPLTSFVAMSLGSIGLQESTIVKRAVGFLLKSQRKDGSWPIDTNLDTWTSTLAINGLGYQSKWASPERASNLREWLLGQQYRHEHPYTHSPPGGWAWTNLPGGVPDADDSAGALIALLKVGPVDEATELAGRAGVGWLLQLQNRDGGIPTFCRGWGALPFDRSSPDLTAHALRAWSAWLPHLGPKLKRRTLRAIDRSLRYLLQTQSKEGTWVPLWFGNEYVSRDENPTYGTAQVLIALRELRERGFSALNDATANAEDWLKQAQNADGGWGGSNGAPSTVEETALAVEALAGTAAVGTVDSGVRWLVERVEEGTWNVASPIGFYFAKLWYFEKLYPLIFTVGALGRAASYLQE